ncbi:MAG: long-chain fatty acid--CoA ligase [Bacillota bacterium]|nr:long-chain fatty acid--CoA ligase [Bacillota bacterium]
MEKIWTKSYAPGVPVKIDFDQVTMSAVLSRTAEKYPDYTALNWMGYKIRYSELEKLVNKIARAFTALGVEAGDKVALLMPNLPQTVIADYAAFRIGAVCVMNNPLYTERELKHQLNDSDAKIAVILDLLLPRMLKLKNETGIENIITCHINDYLPFPKKQLYPIVKKDMYRKIESMENVFQFTDLINKYSDDQVEECSSWDEVGALLYTGGTTGLSKGVMQTHANLSMNVQQFAAWLPGIAAGEKMLADLPYFHTAGFTIMQNLPVWMGLEAITIPRPDPENVLEAVKKYKPHYLPGVPTIYNGLLNNNEFRSMDLSFIKNYFSGGAPLPIDTFNRLKELNGADLISIYGLTECTVTATVSPWGGKVKPGTEGIPVPNTEIKIVDLETGRNEMAPGESGEILIKGPQVMKGYYKNPDATAEILKEGWLYTGDIGFMDEDGYLSVIDRKKDIIIAGGFNIYPNEVDEILYSHPRIAEACTIGVPDQYRGETVKAFVVLQEGENIDPEEIIDYCRQSLAAYKLPTEVEFVDSLPKSGVGKILRRILKEKELSEVK